MDLLACFISGNSASAWSSASYPVILILGPSSDIFVLRDSITSPIEIKLNEISYELSEFKVQLKFLTYANIAS